MNSTGEGVALKLLIPLYKKYRIPYHCVDLKYHVTSPHNGTVRNNGLLVVSLVELLEADGIVQVAVQLLEQLSRHLLQLSSSVGMRVSSRSWERKGDKGVGGKGSQEVKGVGCSTSSSDIVSSPSSSALIGPLTKLKICRRTRRRVSLHCDVL